MSHNAKLIKLICLVDGHGKSSILGESHRISCIKCNAKPPQEDHFLSISTLFYCGSCVLKFFKDNPKKDDESGWGEI